MNNETLFIPLTFLKKISDENLNKLQASVDVDLVREKNPNLLWLRTHRVEMIEDEDTRFFRLWLISSDEQFACQDVTHAQYDDIIELNDLFQVKNNKSQEVREWTWENFCLRIKFIFKLR